jgi:NAD-dependent dihydropyrimidine dehydrogenase PreA subunit
LSPLKTAWGLLFRLFPCPTQVGLRRVGDADRESPVLVTCNFDLTVKRLAHVLERAKLDAWLLVAESRGVNVWCAAGGDEFNTHSVVSAVKTSGIADRVDHRTLILPPLGAPGICAAEVAKQTGWKVRWGPVRAADLPGYLASGSRRTEQMKRVTFSLGERLDTGLGSLFLFYLAGALGFAILARDLLATYLWVGVAAFVLFMSLCPWLPGKRGITKTLSLEAVLGAALVVTEVVGDPGGLSIRAELIIAMVMLLVYGTELGGLSSTMRSELDPFLARLGIGAVGNVAFAGTIRTELLNGFRVLTCDRDLCQGCRRCCEICPQGVWEMDEAKRAMLAHPDACTACRACLVQCASGAISAPRARPRED